MENLLNDLRYGVRQLGKSPGFTVAAVITLALGIGTNTAIFSVLHAVLLRPLPYSQPDRLVMIWSDFQSGGTRRVSASGPEWVALRERSRLLSDVAATWITTASLTGTGEPEQLRISPVTSNFFSLLGTPAQLGRTFLPAEQGTGSPAVVVLSDGLWRRRFGASPSVIGQTIHLGGDALTVVGVMPPDFRILLPSDAAIPPDVQAWVTFRYDLAKAADDEAFLRVVGRMRPGVTVPQLQSELSGIAGELRSETNAYATESLAITAEPLHQDTVRDVRASLLTLFAAVGMVLLIACANVGNLLLVRASSRSRETNIRFALGASAWRIARQFFLESTLLASLGGITGIAVAYATLKLLVAIRPAGLSQLSSIDLSLTAIVFSLAVSVLVGILCGLAPIFSYSHSNIGEMLQKTGRGITTAMPRSQQILVFSEVVLSVVLLIGSGLMIRSFVKLLNTDPGFQADHVLTFQLAPSGVRYPDDQKMKDFFLNLQKEIVALPGVQSVGAITHLPLDDYANWYEYVWPQGASVQEQMTHMADHRGILPGYLSSMRVPLLAGRDFNESDNADKPNVIIVDETLARQAWPNQSAIGKKLHVVFIHNSSFESTWAEVVGVAKHVRYENLTTEVRGEVYVPYLQSAREKLSFTVRTSGDPSSLIGPIREAVANLDKDVPLYKVQPMETYVARARTATRFTTVLFAFLAGLALVLASIGIYGLVSYWVVQRTREIGIRMTLGGRPSDILQMVVGRAFRVIFGGILLGLAVSLVVTRLIMSLLYGVPPHDPVTLCAAAIVLAVPGLIASYIPAYRAMRVDPVVALRYE